MGKRLITAGFVLALFLQGCGNNGMEIGNNWLSAHSRTLVIDTCTLELTNVMLDSIPTSGGGKIFAGIRRSDLWGETRTSTFMTFNITSDFVYEDSRDYSQYVRFDSLTLYMKPYTMFAGDTTKLATLRLYRLAEQVELNDYGELYGHSDFEHDPAPLVERSFYPAPLYGKAMEFRLPDALGREFLDKLTGQAEEMESDADFRDYFKGMVIAPDPSCEAIMSFEGADSTCMMKLYYHTVSDNVAEHVLTFPLTMSNMFTRVESDRAGAPLDGISFRNSELASSRTGNKAFLQGLTGIYTKIDVPYLNNIRGLGDHGTVVSASLVIYPLSMSYHRQNYAALPDDLQLYVSNEMNETIGVVTDGGDSSDAQSAILKVDEMFPDETCYTFDVTDFIKDQMGKIGANKRSLQLVEGALGYTLNDLVFGDRHLGGNGIELKITYSIFDEE